MSKAAGPQRARWLHCMEEGLGAADKLRNRSKCSSTDRVARSLAAAAAACKQSCCGLRCRVQKRRSERASGAPTCSPASEQGRKEASCSGTPTKYPTRTGQEHGMAADLISLFLFRGGRCPLPQRGRRAPTQTQPLAMLFLNPDKPAMDGPASFLVAHKE